MRASSAIHGFDHATLVIPAPSSLPLILPPTLRARGVTAVLGPTNTGKTHLAIERMVGYGAGIIGLPLRLLAREVYQRIVEKTAPNLVALITGEEKIKPDGARYWVCTAEAMPREIDAPFVAIDEIQIAADLERGHVFTDRMLNRRGSQETLLLGSGTMRGIVEKLIPGVNVVTRPRLSNLMFAGEKKLTRLPRRSAIVAFSAQEVYEIAEVIRRQRGGAAVVLGALSPRTRNAQVSLYQNGDVDYLVATDAIGMGLNLDVEHIAFAGDRKFDGYQFRKLNPSEFGQIAGRAGRHVRDGTFGTTGRCAPLEDDLVKQIEAHDFDPVKVLQWRNTALDFTSLESLFQSLSRPSSEDGLTRAPDADDIRALSIVIRDERTRGLASGAAAVERLWDVTQLPDYRKISPNAHAEIIETIFGFLTEGGRIPDDWFDRQLALVDRTDGDIDTLSARIAQTRTWTFAANRPDWLKDATHWQGVTRAIEDKLSDALHERLAQRFVDRRTSVLLRRLRENAMLETEIAAGGDVMVEGHHVGTLSGFTFVADPTAGDGDSGKALRAAATKALAGEIESRAQRFSQAPDNEIALAIDGVIRWVGQPVARLVATDKVTAPRIAILADEQLTGPARDLVQTRLDIFVQNRIRNLLGPLLVLEQAEDIPGIAKGIAFRLVEALGILDRQSAAEDLKALDQAQRSALRRYGVRFGAYHLYLPALMKPAPRALSAQLWALAHGGTDKKGLDEVPHLAHSGRTSIKVDPEIDKTLYRLVGYRVAGERAVRVDILERLADIIRPAIAYRPGETVGDPPDGAADGDAFVVTGKMTSLLGCSGEDFNSILKALGYRSETRKGAAITRPILKPAPMVPVTPVIATGEDAASVEEAGATLTAESADGTGFVSDEVGTPATDALAETASEEPAGTVVPMASDEGAPTPEEPAAIDLPAENAPSEDAIGADAPSENASSDDSAGETTPAALEVADGASAEAPAEAAPVIETVVWRQARFERHHRPRGEARPKRPERPAPKPREPKVWVIPPAPERKPPPDRPAPPAGDAAPAPDRKPWRRDGDRPRDERRDDKGDAPAAKGEPPKKKFNKTFSGPAGAFGKTGGSDGPPGSMRSRDDNRNWRAELPKTEKPKGGDPDSPFAKLLALKEQMQGKK